MNIFKKSVTKARTYLSVLDEREREIIERRLGFKTGKVETLEEIGESLNLTRERIRQIEAIATKKMNRFGDDLTDN